MWKALKHAVVEEHHYFPSVYLKAQVKPDDFTVLMRMEVKNVAQQKRVKKKRFFGMGGGVGGGCWGGCWRGGVGGGGGLHRSML